MSDTTTGTSTTKAFPLKTKVILHGLKAAEFNDKVGVIQGPVNEENRQSVFVEELNKTVALKLSNLKYQPRPLESLSNKELKNILRFKQKWSSGMDRSDCQAALKDITEDPLEIAEALAVASAGGGGNASTSNDASNVSANTNSMNPSMDQLDQMNPETLKQQAQMMKSMPPATIRQMNPAFANMSDAQIRQAAAQMEMMASNPAMMQQAKQQMKNMTPAQKRQYEQVMAQQSGAAAANTNTGNDNAMQSPQERLANMSPEQLQQQAQAMRSMPKDMLRQMNPQLKNMTDAQIDQAASQMEMMASNPELMKMANEQMKNLTPQQMEEMMKSGAGGDSTKLNPMAMGMGMANSNPGNNNAGNKNQQEITMDPSKMLETMDPKQIKEMMKMLKNNPGMLDNMAAQSGMPRDGLEKMLNMFSDMSDEQLESSLKTMVKFQKFSQGVKNIWKKGDDLVGGNLKKVLIAGSVLFIVFLVLYFLGGDDPASKTANKIIQDNIPLSTPNQEDAVPEIEVDEFSEEL